MPSFKLAGSKQTAGAGLAGSQMSPPFAIATARARRLTSAARCMAAAVVACIERCSCDRPSMPASAPAAASPPTSPCSARRSTPAAAAALLPLCAWRTDSSRLAVARRPRPTAQNRSLQGGRGEGCSRPVYLSVRAAWKTHTRRPPVQAVPAGRYCRKLPGSRGLHQLVLHLLRPPQPLMHHAQLQAGQGRQAEEGWHGWQLADG